MRTFLKLLALCALIFGATVIGGRQVADAYGQFHPRPPQLRDAIHGWRAEIDQARANRCHGPGHYGRPVATIPRSRLLYSISILRHRLHRVQQEPRCSNALWDWYYAANFDCIHAHEASWTDGGAPYWGGLQFSRSFHRYGLKYLRAMGTANHWPPISQVDAAHKAFQLRGYGPWPNTARACGMV
jgi:hypothetical protein